ncbi:MAG: UDP-N-acetylmuramate--L-alanine ligase [Dermatophilaceae bacterium]
MPQVPFDFTAPVPSVDDLGAVHLVAIGGAGMSALARILLDLGTRVTGSDAMDSPTLRALSEEGADVHIGHDPAYLQGADTVVVSSAVRESNVELRAARALGLRVLHRAQALAATMGEQRPVAVAGANGKTTTSSMLAVALQHCGFDPSFAIGGELAGYATNARAGLGDVFVVEADESDRSFLVYHPEVAIVTSVQPDHLDFFGSFEAVETAYREFVATLRPGGLLVAGVDDPGARRLAGWAAGQGVRVIGYGTSPGVDLRVTDPAYERMTASARVLAHGTALTLALGVPGEHNLLNATAALAAAVEGLGAPPGLVLGGLASFSGTRRRFEPKGRAHGVQVVDDYAHNPGKVAAAVSTARRLVSGTGRLVVVFQPHLFSRTRDFAAELGRGLSAADVVVVMDVYAAREDPVPGVTGELVAAAVRAARPACDVRFEPSWSAVAPMVAELVVPGDLVLTVGAGDVTMLGPAVLALLGERQGQA